MRTVRHSNPFLENLEQRRLLSFSPAVSYPVGGADPSLGGSVVTADFNKDGRLDLAVANSSSNNVSVLLGKIDGTFQPAQTSATGARPVAIDVGDFNADGRLDLVTANYTDNTFSVLLGNGQGGFGNPINTTVNVHPQAVAVGDFNSDGKLDVVTASGGVSVSGQSTFSVRLGNGDATFRTTGAYNGLFGESISLATGDFNADGKLDLVVSTTDTYVSDDNVEVHTGRVIVLSGDGQGNFGEPHYYYLRSWFPGDLAVADLDADGKLDVVTANKDSDTVSVLLGNGNGTLRYSSSSSDFATGAAPYSVALGDFNHDGAPDIVSANLDSDTVSILLGHGDGNFWEPEQAAAGPDPRAVAAGDFNRDGRLDVAVSGFDSGSSTNTVEVLLNDGNWIIRTYVGPTGGNWSTAGNWSPVGVPAAGDFVKISGKSVILSTSSTVASLTITGGAQLTLGQNGNRLLRTGALSVDFDSKLDLKDNDLTIDYAGTSPMGAWNDETYAYDGVTGMIQSGQITSSATSALTRLGVGEIAGDVLVMYTYAGDANLDGKLDIDDYTRIDTGIGANLVGWSNGDFNYDGKINIDDYLIIDSNMRIQGAPFEGVTVASTEPRGGLATGSGFVMPPGVEWGKIEKQSDAPINLLA